MTVVRVAAVAEVPEHGVLLVRAAGLELGLFRVRGVVVAWRNHCPHMGAPVCRGVVTGTRLPSPVYGYELGREGEVLQCPWHGWEFDLVDGHHLAPGSRVRLRGYPVQVVDAEVLVELRDGPVEESPADRVRG